jgi:hypothetical protein
VLGTTDTPATGTPGKKGKGDQFTFVPAGTAAVILVRFKVEAVI